MSKLMSNVNLPDRWKCHEGQIYAQKVVPRAGVEPARALCPTVFETVASTIPPPRHLVHVEREPAYREALSAT